MEDEEMNMEEELSSEAHSEARSRDWEMIEDNSNGHQEDDEDFSVFPPSHHEGLHSQGQTLLPPQSPPPLNVNGGQQPSHNIRREPVDSRLRVARDAAMKRLNIAFHIVSSKIFRVSALARSGRAKSLFAPVTGVTVAFVVSIWFLKWQRWRRQELQETKIDQLLNLVRHQDEKITLLLDHMSRLNEILSTRRRISIFRSS